jgi:large subunit ribosomal protein L35
LAALSPFVKTLIQENKMPKMKTKSGAKKRFRVTGTGRVKFKPAKSRHMMMNKPKSMKRKIRGMQLLADCDARIILENFVPYLRGRKKVKKAVAAPKTDKAA